MDHDSDGIEEAFEGQLRVMLTAAGQVGERISRMREEALRRAASASEQEARALHSRLVAERDAARAALATVHRPQWWDQASPDQIATAHQTARAWSREDPDAERAERRIRQEVRTRFGVDVDAAGGDPAAVRAAVERASALRAESGGERSRAGVEHVEAAQLVAEAETADRLAEESRQRAREQEQGPGDVEEARVASVDAEQHERSADDARSKAAPRYDSAERREATAAELTARGLNSETVDTRMRADVSQAKPATEAVKPGAAGRSLKARRTRGRGARAQRSLGR